MIDDPEVKPFYADDAGEDVDKNRANTEKAGGDAQHSYGNCENKTRPHGDSPDILRYDGNATDTSAAKELPHDVRWVCSTGIFAGVLGDFVANVSWPAGVEQVAKIKVEALSWEMLGQMPARRAREELEDKAAGARLG